MSETMMEDGTVLTAYEGMGRFVLNMTAEAMYDMSSPWDRWESVSYWAPRITRPSACTPEVLANALREYGAWDEAELADDDANWRRIVWVLACDLREENEP